LEIRRINNTSITDDLRRRRCYLEQEWSEFVIMTPMFGNVPEHAHFIASDLSRDAEDFDQILGTPWIMVVEVKPWSSPSL
jgi:hypothetical protein